MSNVGFTLIGIGFGAILGFLFSWLNSIIIIKTQETARAKRKFRKFLINLIIKIRHNDFDRRWKLWRNLRDYCLISDEAIYNISFYLNKTDRMSVTKAYNYYKHPDIVDSLVFDEPFEIYDIDEEIANKIPDFEHKNGVEFAIYNLKKILEFVI